MFTEERQAAIIQCLQEKGKVKVRTLPFYITLTLPFAYPATHRFYCTLPFALP